jgi:hypothetical protein
MDLYPVICGAICKPDIIALKYGDFVFKIPLDM